jgi:hypothetical protein
MAMVNKDLEWLSRRTEEYRSSKDDAMGIMENLDEIGQLGRGFSSMDDLDKCHTPFQDNGNEASIRVPGCFIRTYSNNMINRCHIQ